MSCLGRIVPYIVAGSLMIPAVASADLKVYGAAKISLDYIDDSLDRNFGVSSNLSYIGIKGGHQINDALKGGYKIEMGVDVTGESSNLSPRWRYIGVQGKLGSIRVGNMPNAFRILGKLFDEFPETIGEDRGVLGLSAAGAPKYDIWSNNTITYLSPKMNGAQVTVVYSTAYDGASTVSGSDDNDQSLAGVVVSYTEGPLKLRAAFEGHEDDDSDGVRLLAKYKFPRTSTRLGLVYETIDAGIGNPLSRDAYGFNVAQPVNDLTYKVQVLKADEYEGSVDSAAVNTSVGIFKQLDRLVSIYVMYGVTDNDPNARYTIASVGHTSDRITPPSAGDDVKAVSFGGVYLFE